jgi:ABC-type lipoprotein export system ATPase subunit
VTHDVAKARRAERVIQMQDGRIERELRGADLDGLAEALEAAGGHR